MKIVFFEIEDSEAAPTNMLAPNHEVVCDRTALDADNVAAFADASVISTALASSLDPGVLAKLPKLQLIATRSTGFDHIDLGYCKGRDIGVCNVPTYGDVTVAEHVFALLLALSRHIVDCVEATRRGDFAFLPQRGFELKGKTLGVIGTGHIGRRVIEIAHGFGMQAVAFDSFPRPELATALGFRYANLPELLSLADVVTLHVPATPETSGMISDAQFAQMKDGVVLINTARGSVVDIAALIRALSSRKVGAAGLDVLPSEKLVREEEEIFRKDASLPSGLPEALADHVLLRFPNVIVTPHNAYNTSEALRRIVATTVDNIIAFTQGRRANRIV